MATVADGDYRRKQLGCKSRVIAWSHGARFRKAVSLVGTHPGRRLLDYGCGDGTFVSLVAGKFEKVVGADIAADHVEDCRRRFAGVPGVEFRLVGELAGSEHSGAYHTVTCMETLEHCTEPVVGRVLDDLDRLCRRDGTVVVSVPIEIGPTFAIKYLVRKLAAWRRLSDYRYYENYALRDAVRMVFATRSTVVPRPVYGGPGGEFHSHYGFNWRRMRDRVARTFRVVSTQFSPLGVFGGLVSSQAWFLCRPRNPTVFSSRPGDS